ncbi:hypothetical protein H0H87_000814, partial [Tephrocybe sp. NHM501043]
MSAIPTPEYQPCSILKGNMAQVSAITFSDDASLVFIGGDDGHVRIFPTSKKDSCNGISAIQVLCKVSWGKVTSLSYLQITTLASGLSTYLAVGNICWCVTLILGAQNST